MEQKITKNEKFVLKELIDNGRISDTAMAKKLKISSQAVRKIRKKFEKNKLIKKYSTIIDYEKISIKAFAIVQLKFSEKISKKSNILSSPNIIGAFKLPGTQVTHLFIMGFSSLEELDSYFEKIKQEFSNEIEIQKLDIFPNIGLMKNSPAELLKKKIDSF